MDQEDNYAFPNLVDLCKNHIAKLNAEKDKIEQSGGNVKDIKNELFRAKCRMANYNAKVKRYENMVLHTFANWKEDESCDDNNNNNNNNNNVCMRGVFNVNHGFKLEGGSCAIVKNMNNRSSGESKIVDYLCSNSGNVEWTEEHVKICCSYLNVLRNGYNNRERLIGEKSPLRFFKLVEYNHKKKIWETVKNKKVIQQKRIMGGWWAYRQEETKEDGNKKLRKHCILADEWKTIFEGKDQKSLAFIHRVA